MAEQSFVDLKRDFQQLREEMKEHERKRNAVTIDDVQEIRKALET